MERLELPPVLEENFGDKIINLVTASQTSRLVFAGLVVVLVTFALILVGRQASAKSKGKRKTKLQKPWSEPKSAVLSALLVALGGLVVWQVLAAAPLMLWSSWADKVPLRVADKGVGVNISAAIAPWNTLAGRSIFVASTTSPQVVFVKTSKSYSYTNRTSSLCTIYVSKNSVSKSSVLQHELGHCLGFTDHVYAQFADDFNFKIGVCDDDDHPDYVNYRGIMSYCSFFHEPHTWFGKDDWRGMRTAKYLADSRNPYYCPAPHPSLRLGNTGGCVKHLQWNLDNIRKYRDTLGSKSPLYVGTIDGVFDSTVKKAVQNYETSKGYTADGVVGGTLWKAIHGSCAYIITHLSSSKTQPATKC